MLKKARHLVQSTELLCEGRDHAPFHADCERVLERVFDDSKCNLHHRISYLP